MFILYSINIIYKNQQSFITIYKLFAAVKYLLLFTGSFNEQYHYITKI